MKKIIVLLFLVLSLPVNAAVLEGGIDYNVNSAREALLENSDRSIDINLIQAHIIDIQHKENISYIYQGKAELKDRVLAFFSDSTYAVMLNNDPLHVWYYALNGDLLYAEKKDRVQYPYKSYKYTTSGRLVNMSLRVSKGETFIYSPDGKLIAHWIGANAYDESNRVIMTRKYSE